MGWDPWQDVKDAYEEYVAPTVSTVSNTVNREVSNFSNTVNRDIDNASRGDVGKFIVDQASAVKSLAVAPIETIYHGVRGDGKQVNYTLQRAIGGLTNIAGGLSVNLAQNNQSFYRDKELNKYTLGYAEDFAGFSRGANTLQRDAYLSPEDKNSAIRYGIKSAAIGAGVKYGPGLYDDFMGASYYTKGTTVAATGGIVDSILKGDMKGAAKGISKLIGAPDISEYIPDNPKDVPVYGDGPKSTAPVGSTSPQVNDPWGFSGYSNDGLGTVAKGSTIPLLIGAGVLGYLVYRKIK